ncbi:SRPBCC family protein [Heyndrickxia vini]|uniref:SRPBCC family protein n=1 Tax=Heyndrickxia vini TaxID=1476025 RepID=A0ABX7E1S9_9BACI|nr:SRPBCC family protein [Heyndrickxia vini]QQZ09683.1 SRPBCC family protein [Heyndrickxia vini]
MLASIQKVEDHYVAKFERQLQHPVEKVWAMLTDNQKLSKWFSELRVKDLRKGGMMLFDMQDGTFEEMEITEFEMYSILEYTWAEDNVRFELYKEQDGCLLILNETINKMTNHTPKDLAGWHVCLDVISALLDGRTIESRKNEWEKWYVKYIQLTERYM